MKMKFATLFIAAILSFSPGSTVAPSDVPTVGPALQVEPKYARDRAIVLLVDKTAELNLKLHWVVVPLDGGAKPDVLKIPGGVAVWGTPGTYQVVCIAAEAKVVSGAAVVTWHDLRAVIEIVIGIPGPDPPQPPPGGDFADVTKTVKGVAELVKTEKKAEERKMISESFAENARLTAGDKEYDQARLLELTQSNVVAELGLNRFLAWKQIFTTVRSEVQRQMDAGKLKNKQDWVRVWTAIAAGVK